MNRGKVIEYKSCTNIPELFVVITATDCSEVKFKYSPPGFKFDTYQFNVNCIKEKIYKTLDLFYGVEFDFSVKNLRIWIGVDNGTDTSTKELDIINFSGKSEVVKSVFFKQPISLIGYYTIFLSFGVNEAEFETWFLSKTSDESIYKLIKPVFTFGILNNVERQKIFAASPGTGLFEGKIVPKITLADGSLFDINTVEINGSDYL